jgi:hypothetical protein
MDREWVNAMAGYEVSDDEALQFLADFNDWLDRYEFSLEAQEEMV